MITQTFEIKVALLGYVSVGKTTVLNALLQDKFSEVSMRRTTAGVNFFRIVTTANSNGKADETAGVPNISLVDGIKTKNADSMAWTPLADEPVHTAPSTLEEITKDNQKLREEKSIIQEKTFNVELNKPLCDMRNDTTLVLVDIPGLNEADSKKMYLHYVSEQWDTFDCVVVVMDAEKGVNTEEQVELLNLVKNRLETSKRYPVLVLCNKVDDTEDEELMELVGEVRTKVEEIFKVGNREASLNELVTAFRDNTRCCEDSVFPAFIPLSAGNAFAYRMAANCSLEKFQELDIKLLDKIGRDEVGKNKWKTMSLDDKYKIVLGAVCDETQYHERLESTNFDKFLMALAYSIGGDNVQRKLLEKQIEIALQKLSSNSSVVTKLRSIYDKCKAIEQHPEHLKHSFWKVFEKIRNAAIDQLRSNIYPTILAETMDQLIKYGEFVRTVGWNDEEGKIIKEVVSLVRQQIGVVCQSESEWKIDDAVISSQPGAHFPWDWKRHRSSWLNVHTKEEVSGSDNPAHVTVSWKTLTYHDWTSVIGMLLLMSANEHFVERFGREKLLLEKLLQRHTQYANCMANCVDTAEENARTHILSFTAGHYKDGKFLPTDSRKYGVVVQVVTPELISDPSHWGHVIWRFCNFMGTVNQSAF